MTTLDTFAALMSREPLQPAFARGVQTYVATCGNRRVFLSAADVAAYERGFSHWPEPLPDEMNTPPTSTGWFDAAQNAELRAEARIEREQERMEERDWGY